MSRISKLYREYDKETGRLIKLECGKCREIKTVDNFYMDNDKKDGVGTTCKSCRTNYHKNYHKNNKEKSKERYRKYVENNKDKLKEYYENNKDKIREYQSKYYENNKDKLNEYRNQYNKDNKDKVNEYQSKYYENNKDKLLEYSTNYRNNKINEQMEIIYENITKKLYPNKGIQYGIIYGVHCKVNDRWYIGQTTSTFNIRYAGNFFKNKSSELSEDNTKRQLLTEDIEKYGEESFEIFEVIDVAFSEKELDEKEVYYIDIHKAYEEGYNSYRGNIFKHYKDVNETLTSANETLTSVKETAEIVEKDVKVLSSEAIDDDLLMASILLNR